MIDFIAGVGIVIVSLWIIVMSGRNIVKNIYELNRRWEMNKFNGMRWDDFEKWLEEKYPFGEINFDGGGGIYIDTGERVAFKGEWYPIEVETGLIEGADDEGSFVRKRIF